MAPSRLSYALSKNMNRIVQFNFRDIINFFVESFDRYVNSNEVAHILSVLLIIV